MLVPVTLAVAVLLVTAGQAVFAASNQTISGCYYKDGVGFLKIVNGPAQCRNNEVAVTWNKTGPRGPVGPKGPKGETGDRGPAGPRRATGARGPEDNPPSFAFARATDSVSTSNTNSYQDLGGPTVTVDVPASRFIEVGASAFVQGEAGAVSLFDVSDSGPPLPVAGQSDICDEISGAPDGVGLFFTSMGDGFFKGTYATPATPHLVGGFCTNTGGPGTGSCSVRSRRASTRCNSATRRAGAATSRPARRRSATAGSGFILRRELEGADGRRSQRSTSPLARAEPRVAA